MKSTALTLVLLVMVGAAAAQGSRLVVHEWGTFTSFQDENGRTIAGINADDEPVPAFVHRMVGMEIFATTSRPARWSQGAPRCHPDVTLRLETPVLYFYPSAGWTATFDVRASFNGGWLTEFYPAATAEGTNFPSSLSADSRGSLTWKGLRLDPGATASMPQTSEHVWLAPRKAASAIVANETNTEAEKYLFYRGVGHFDAPLVVQRRGDTLSISLRDGEAGMNALPRLWLVDVAEDGRVRYRTLNAVGSTIEAPVFPTVAGGLPSSLAALRGELAAALQASGLFADEADAMLETWRLSYFESTGLRVFFILPAQWTDARLPLSISAPAEVTRVMVGRVELVNPRQRVILARLQQLADEDFPQLPLYYEDQRVLAMRGISHSALYRETGREVPESLRLYESLGRFRDALLAHEWQSVDFSQRARIEKVIRAFSACEVEFERPAGVVRPQPASAR
jgi:hypothetical protein